MKKTGNRQPKQKQLELVEKIVSYKEENGKWPNYYQLQMISGLNPGHVYNVVAALVKMKRIFLKTSVEIRATEVAYDDLDKMDIQNQEEKKACAGNN